MAGGFKCLAQSELTVNGHIANVTIYTVPAVSGARFATNDSSTAIISSIILCCTLTGGTYSIRVLLNDAAAANSQYLYFHQVMAADETDVLSLGIGLVAGDRIQASASVGSIISMSIFGTEST